MVGLAEQNARSSASSPLASGANPVTGPNDTQQMACVQLSGRFEDDHFVGKWRFDGSPQWLDFEFEKDNGTCFRGHFQIKDANSLQNIPETIMVSRKEGIELSGTGHNEFGEFEFWGKMDESTKSFEGFKKYIQLKQGSEKLMVSSPSANVNGAGQIKQLKKQHHSLSPSSLSQEVKRLRVDGIDLDDSRGIMDDTLIFEGMRKDDDENGEVVDASEVFANDEDGEADFDPSEDLLTEFQLLTEGPAGLMVEELIGEVGGNSNHLTVESPLAPYEPLPAEVSSPISPLPDFHTNVRSRQHLTPATIAAPPSSSAKPRAESSKTTLPPVAISSEGSLSSSGTSNDNLLGCNGGGHAVKEFASPPVVRISSSYRDPFDESRLTTSKARSRRRVRDFVAGLQNRHFYPYDATDVGYGLPVYHPLHPHVKVVYVGYVDGVLVENESQPVSPGVPSETSSTGKKRSKSMQASNSSTSHHSISTATGRRGSISSVGGKTLEIYASQIRYPGSMKCNGAKSGSTSAQKPDYQEAKLELDGSCYEGELLGGLRHGKGIAGYFNGCVYIGDFRKGHEHGFGELRDATGALIYRGEYEHGKICGQGTFYYPDGSVYRGDMREGTRHGQGIIWYSDGSAYEGDFVHGVRCGMGTFIAPDGSQYAGEWSHDVRHGKGTLKLSNGTVLDGQFKDNHADGRCSVSFAKEEAEYEGNFKDGLKDGRGTYRFNKHLAVYEGRFARDVIGGTGTLKLCPDKVIELSDGDGDEAKAEWMIPVDLNCEVRLAHLRAGFGVDGL